MAQYGYSIKDMNETRAHAVLRDAPISYKAASMIAQHIKGMEAKKALTFLQAVQRTEQAVPYTKFSDGVGHRPGIGPGRYPGKAAKLFEATLANAVANAEDKNLGKDVWVEFVVAQQGSRGWHPGNSGRHKFKRSHVEIVVTNVPMLKKERSANKKSSKPTSSTAPKKTASKNAKEN